jgi:hypothetical protein
MRRLEVDPDAAPAGVGWRTLRTREALGSRPGPLRGSAAGRLDWDRQKRENMPAPRPGKSGPEDRKVAVARRIALRGCNFVADGGADRDKNHLRVVRHAATPHRLRGHCLHLGRVSATAWLFDIQTPRGARRCPCRVTQAPDLRAGSPIGSMVAGADPHSDAATATGSVSAARCRFRASKMS